MMSTVNAKKFENAHTTAAVSSGIGMIIRQKEPVNLEFPFDKLNSFITPNDLFYIRSHFQAPELTTDYYQLRIHGAVENPLSLDYQQLREFPSETRTATLECAGNSRIFLVPQVEGAQWELGAVGNAEWTGVPLRVLLEQTGLAKNACEVVFEGADRGTPKEQPIPPGPISYARSLPLAKAVRPEVLVAYQMNGRELSRDHGYPVRLIVPGYYGMASVKWLTSIQVLEEPFQGYWQTSDYGYWDYIDGKPVRRPLSEMALKSQIARPGMYEVIPAGSDYIVTGAAWCGHSDVSEIELSTDGGQHWTAAEFMDPAQPYVWRRWQFLWHVPQKPGQYTLAARAQDATGAVQPEGHNPSHGTYVINHPLPIDVIVR
jgi:DMSO/TMAO reductase YedYZ molybdopterin-dependent catalytic subunit